MMHVHVAMYTHVLIYIYRNKLPVSVASLSSQNAFISAICNYFDS